MKRSQFLNHDQKKSSACVSFASCNVIYFKTKEKIDPLFLHKKARKLMPKDTSGLNFNAIRNALSQYYDFKKVPVNLAAFKSLINKGVPFIISVKVQEVYPNQNSGYHAVVVYKIEGDTIYYINTAEPTWGPFNDNSGYFRFRPGIINWAFDIIPNKKKTK